MQLENYIADLLHRHDCVIVPDFGGFVANYKAAEIDRIRNKIYPPSKSVLFNPHLTTNDGLLGNYVAQQQKTDYPEALKLIAEKVNQWQAQISEGDRIEIGEIGFLYQENGKIQLEQSRDVNLLLEAYGLKAIDFVSFKTSEKSVAREKSQRTSVKEELQIPNEVEASTSNPDGVQKQKESSLSADTTPLKPEKKAEKKELTSNTTQSKSLKKKKSETTIALNAKERIQKKSITDRPHGEHYVQRQRPVITMLKYVAAAAIVPILFYSYWIPMETDALETKSIQFSDFNPIHKQSEKVYEKRTKSVEYLKNDKHNNWEELTGHVQSSVYSYEVTEDFYVPILLDDSKEKEVINHSQINGNSNYHLISGCFSVKDNALNKIESLQASGFPATILDQSKGLHRVTAGGYNNRSEAQNALDKLRSAGFSAWILKQ